MSFTKPAPTTGGAEIEALGRFRGAVSFKS
jgi:hypothetical protein